MKVYCSCVCVSVAGPADDHAGHCDPAADVVLLSPRFPGAPVTALTALHTLATKLSQHQPCE